MSEVTDWNAKIIEEFRANEGNVGGRFEGAPLLLLHTIGAKSGVDRASPMMYLADDSRMFVFASKAGADTHPDWYHNLQKNPDVVVELGSGTFTARATSLPEEERAPVYAIQAERYPGFAEYEAKTARVIPVVELIREKSEAT